MMSRLLTMQIAVLRPILAVAMVTGVSTARAAGDQAGSIELACTAEMEIVEVDAQGDRHVKTVAAVKVLPGNVVLYRLSYRHVGDEPAENVIITDPIPEHMVYVGGSAVGKGTDIIFSVDGGKAFGKAEDLKVTEADGTERPARPEEYTHVRWKLRENLPIDGKGDVSFKAQLK